MQGDRAHGTAYPGRLADRGRPCADLDRPHGSRRRRPSVNKQLVAELTRCEYIDQRENILLVGNPGTGKSHLATALAAEACARGYKVRFYRATELVTTLIEARDERSFLRLKTQLAKLDLLVLDELGYVPASAALVAIVSCG